MVRMLSVEFGGNVNISDLQVRKIIYFAPYTIITIHGVALV